MLGLLILIGGTIFCWVYYSNFSKSNSSDAPTQVIETTTGQVTLIELDVSANSPTVGEELVVNLDLNQVTNPLSAISIKLSLPLESADQFTWGAEPFAISQALQDAGWQILVNQIEVGGTKLEVELAMGQLSIADKVSPALLFDQTFAQLYLTTTKPLASGEIIVDTLISKIVTQKGETLPLQVTSSNYSVNEP